MEASSTITEEISSSYLRGLNESCVSSRRSRASSRASANGDEYPFYLPSYYSSLECRKRFQELKSFLDGLDLPLKEYKQEFHTWFSQSTVKQRQSYLTINDPFFVSLLRQMYRRMKQEGDIKFALLNGTEEAANTEAAATFFNEEFSLYYKARDLKCDESSQRRAEMAEEILKQLRFCDSEHYLDSFTFEEEILRDPSKFISAIRKYIPKAFSHPCVLSDDKQTGLIIWDDPKWFRQDQFSPMGYWIVCKVEKVLWSKFWEWKYECFKYQQAEKTENQEEELVSASVAAKSNKKKQSQIRLPLGGFVSRLDDLTMFWKSLSESDRADTIGDVEETINTFQNQRSGLKHMDLDLNSSRSFQYPDNKPDPIRINMLSLKNEEFINFLFLSPIHRTGLPLDFIARKIGEKIEDALRAHIHEEMIKNEDDDTNSNASSVRSGRKKKKKKSKRSKRSGSIDDDKSATIDSSSISSFTASESSFSRLSVKKTAFDQFVQSNLSSQNVKERLESLETASKASNGSLNCAALQHPQGSSALSTSSFGGYSQRETGEESADDDTDSQSQGTSCTEGTIDSQYSQFSERSKRKRLNSVESVRSNRSYNSSRSYCSAATTIASSHEDEGNLAYHILMNKNRLSLTNKYAKSAATMSVHEVGASIEEGSEGSEIEHLSEHDRREGEQERNEGTIGSQGLLESPRKEEEKVVLRSIFLTKEGTTRAGQVTEMSQRASSEEKLSLRPYPQKRVKFKDLRSCSRSKSGSPRRNRRGDGSPFVGKPDERGSAPTTGEQKWGSYMGEKKSQYRRLRRRFMDRNDTYESDSSNHGGGCIKEITYKSTRDINRSFQRRYARNQFNAASGYFTSSLTHSQLKRMEDPSGLNSQVTSCAPPTLNGMLCKSPKDGEVTRRTTASSSLPVSASASRPSILRRESYAPVSATTIENERFDAKQYSYPQIDDRSDLGTSSAGGDFDRESYDEVGRVLKLRERCRPDYRKLFQEEKNHSIEKTAQNFRKERCRKQKSPPPEDQLKVQSWQGFNNFDQILAASFVKNSNYYDDLWLRKEGENRFFALLTQEINSFARRNHESLDSVRTIKYQIAEWVTSVCKHCFQESPQLTVELFGSTATGLALPHSDLDLVVSGLPQVEKSQLKYSMRLLAEELKGFKWVSECFVIDTAYIPVLKMELNMKEIKRDLIEHREDATRNYEIIVPEDFDLEKWDIEKVDITFYDFYIWDSSGTKKKAHHGPDSVVLIRDLIMRHIPLYPMTILLKELLARESLHEYVRGGINSYGLIILIVAWLNNYSYLKTGLGELLYWFLDFYGFRYEPLKDGVSLLNGGCFFSIYMNDMTPLLILDPFNSGNNIGRNSRCFPQVQVLFRALHHKLTEKKEAFIEAYRSNPRASIIDGTESLLEGIM